VGPIARWVGARQPAGRPHHNQPPPPLPVASAVYALVGLLAGRVSPEAAVADAAVAVVTGDPAELRRLLELFRFADPVAA
jgi:hypothetical protein